MTFNIIYYVRELIILLVFKRVYLTYKSTFYFIDCTNLLPAKTCIETSNNYYIHYFN